MIKVKVKTNNNLKNYLNKIEKELEKVPQKATDFFKYQAPTPIRSGNARRKTSLKNNSTIEANYPYAKKLDEGYSPQAPNGMTKPTIEYVRQLVKKIIKGTI